MTTAERLVQSMAKEKLAAVTASFRPELDAVHRDVPLSEVLPAVRQAVAVIRRLGPRVDEMERVVRDHGYELHSSGKLHQGFKAVQAQQRRVNETFQAQKADIAKLRDMALIRLTGLDQKALKGSVSRVLKEFQAELAKL